MNAQLVSLLALASLVVPVVMFTVHGSASAKPSTAKTKTTAANYTGYYQLRYSNVSNTLRVLQTPDGKIKFQLVALLLVGDSPRNGEVAGVAELKNGTATYSADDGCKVTMKFAPDKVTVKVADADACAFGAFVTGDGDYKKKDGKVPKFDF